MRCSHAPSSPGSAATSGSWAALFTDSCVELTGLLLPSLLCDGLDCLESWSFGKLLPICLHFLTFLVTCWYVWLSPTVWMAADVRRAQHTPFWRTLLHGVKDGPNTYAAPSRHEEQKRKQQPKKDAQVKTVTVAPTAGARVAPAPAAAVAVNAAHQPGTQASSLRPSPPTPAVPSDHAAAVGVGVGVDVDSIPLRQHDSSRQHAWPSGEQPPDAM